MLRGIPTIEMDATTLSLVLLAAVLHAVWNFLIKATEDRILVAYWATAAGVVIFSPALFLYPPQAEIWPYAVTSGLVETIYLLVLVYAYRVSDFSQAYPLARGTAPALLTVWAAIFLSERLSVQGALGLGVLLVGLFITASGSILKATQTEGKGRWRGILAALAVAVCISIYSTIDAAAVQRMNPVGYNVLILGLMVLFLTPVVFRWYGWQRVLQSAVTRWKTYVVMGFFIVLTYLLVLIAYSHGNVSYAGALREVSILVGAFLGWRFLGEKMGPVRLVGAGVIVTGILLIALA